MKQLKILHITPWFPLSEKKIEGIFILDQVLALNEFCENHVLHIGFSDEEQFKDTSNYKGIPVERNIIKSVFNNWRFKELLVARKIKRFIQQHQHEFDVVNFMIAYPNAININQYVKRFPDIRFTITEHWSAYHNHFGLDKKNRGRKRIEKIFDNDIPLFVVSNALGEDIRQFTGLNNREYHVIPNVIHKSDFPYKKKENTSLFRFTSINSWSQMKDPFVLINAMERLAEKYPNIRLTLAGNGHYLPEMTEKIKEKQLEKFIDLPGRILKKDVPKLLHETNIYCQSSHYETFSVICVEALCTGTPVIAHKVGGMKDYIDQTNGILVDNLSVDAWTKAMEYAYQNTEQFNHQRIALSTQEKFDYPLVGELYYSHLKKAHNNER